MKEPFLAAKNGILNFSNNLPEAKFSLRLLAEFSVGKGFGLLPLA